MTGRPVRERGARIETLYIQDALAQYRVAPCESAGRGLKLRLVRDTRKQNRRRPVRERGARIETCKPHAIAELAECRPVRERGARIETPLPLQTVAHRQVAPCESAGRGLKLHVFASSRRFDARRPVRERGARIETFAIGFLFGKDYVAPCESAGRGLKPA